MHLQVECAFLFKENIFKLERFEDLIDDVDLVLICTGNHNTGKYINTVCISKNKPAVYSYVGPDAVAGRIIRVIPGRTGCYKCAHEYFDTYPDVYPSLPEVADINALPVDYGCNTPAMPGTSFDTKTIALAHARVAIQTLLSDAGNYPPENMDIFLITNRKIKNIPESNSLWSAAWPLPKWDYCPVCSHHE